MSDPENRFYVYEIVVGEVVRYIGKGASNRASSQISLIRRIARGDCPKNALKSQLMIAEALKAGSCVAYRFLATDLAESDAYELEVASIAQSPAGQLFNVLPGGRGGSSSFLKRMWSDPEFRKKRIAALTAANTTEKSERIRISFQEMEGRS